MYGSSDPNDPENARWHQDPPTDEPAWLTERPEPRSAYLFGDESGERPQADPYRAEPTDRPWADPYRAEPTDRPWAGQPTVRWERPTQEHWHEEPTGRWQPKGEPRRPEGMPPWPPAEQRHEQPTEQWVGLAAYRPGRAGDPPADGDGRRRRERRIPRPLLIGGAAAAATLVVGLGVGTLVLPDGGTPRTEPAADTAAALPIAPGDVFDSTSASPTPSASPSASPTSARPSPTPSRTVRPTRTPSRPTAASRGGQRATSKPSSAPSTPAAGTGSQAQQVVNLVNAERAKAGCGAVKVNSKLTAAAQAHSQDQADHKKMSHDGSDGSDVGERLGRVGYSWRAYGENVAWNQQTPAAVMSAWMNSSGHRANILNCSFTEIGVGVATSNGPYWTQDFGTPR